MTEQPSPCDYHTPILCSLIGIAVVYLWILPLWSGFWLDECATRYVIHGGLAQIIPRCFISLQSFAFSILEWLVSRLGATSGPALRLSSLAAALATLYVLYRLGTERGGRDFGLTLAALFVSLPPVAAAVPNARPYAIAMWAEAGGLLWFFRWLRSGRLQHGLAWVACGVAAGYFHYLFLAPAVLEGLYAAFAFGYRSSRVWRQLAVCGVAGVLLLMPLAPQLREMARQSRWLSSPADLGWLSLLGIAAPPSLLLATALIAGVERLSGSSVRWRAPARDFDVPKSGIVLLVVPAVVYFGISKFSVTNLFLARYLLPSIVGGVVLWGWLIHGFAPRRLRQGLILTGTLFGILATVRSAALPGYVLSYRGQDWAALARTLPATGHLLIYPGLAETARLDWLRDEKRQEYFLAPVALFRPDISPNNADVVPFPFGPVEREYMQAVVQRIIEQREPIAFAGWGLQNAPDWQDWLARQLGAHGFTKAVDVSAGALVETVWMPAR